MSYRKESKYRLTISDMNNIKGDLLAQGMVKIHPARVVHSCYFDTDELALYYESEEGILPRKKIRIRWYDDTQLFSKETKISAIEGRYKYTSVEPKLNCVEHLKTKQYFDRDYGTLNPILIVSYERGYFAFRNLRITFDKNITYESVNGRKSLKGGDDECVMEVKTQISISDNYIQKIIHWPTSRFSKYSRGIIIFDDLIK